MNEMDLEDYPRDHALPRPPRGTLTQPGLRTTENHSVGTPVSTHQYSTRGGKVKKAERGRWKLMILSVSLIPSITNTTQTDD